MASFSQETMRSAVSDDFIMVKQKKEQNGAFRSKELLFDQADELERDGRISLNEWLLAVSDPVIEVWLEAMGIKISNAKKLFHILSTSKNDYLSLDELSNGLQMLRGPAAALDVHMLSLQQQELGAKVDQLLRSGICSQGVSLKAAPLNTAKFLL
eukprot:TRINITY_DN57584_c0_g1_i1.p2 TRINITY_DN57584_c0_g1~~TRINITY_DN57584_c0_g1_i1.p2  ORF type:complete len:155 (-),score=26.09 TRINITY_DN57584_c0_g1_i1:86-550(-)